MKKALMRVDYQYDFVADDGALTAGKREGCHLVSGNPLFLMLSNFNQREFDENKQKNKIRPKSAKISLRPKKQRMVDFICKKNY